MPIEVAIVGGGLAGAAVAWHLAPHARVTLIERNGQPGAEATAQNAGMVRRLGEDPYERALALRTHAWLADPGDDWADLSPSRVTGAVLALAADPHALSDGVAHLRARGARVDALDRPEDVAPALRGAPLVRAWHLPDERVADAHALLTGFLRGARRHGTSIRTGVAVRGLALTGGRVAGLDTDAGPIAADAVVLAAGAWSATLASAVGVARPLFPVRRTLLHSAAHPLSTRDHPWCWVDDVGVYARPEGTGWLVSGCDETIDAAGPRGPVEPEHRALAADKLDRYLPAIADARLATGWTGLRTFAPDRRPYLGADPDLPGLWWAAGLGGFGVTTCHSVGEAVATWLLGGSTDWISPRGVSPGRALPKRFGVRGDGDLRNAHLVPV